MNPELYNALSECIKDGYISVNNTPYETRYIIEGMLQTFELSSEFFARTDNDILIKYSICINDIMDVYIDDPVPLHTEYMPLLKRTRKKQTIKNLMKMCSARIKEIETKRQKNNMFYSVISHDIENVH